MAAAAPEAVALGEVLAAAILALAWLVCLGVLWAYRRSLKRVILGFAHLIDVSVLGRHPLGGVSNWLEAQAANIDHLLAEAVTASERGAVVLFKLFLNTQLWVAREIGDLATDTWHLGVGLGKRLTHLEAAAVSHISSGVSRFVHAAVSKAIAIERRVYDRSFHRTDHRIGALENYVHGKTRPGLESGTFSPALPRVHTPSLADRIAAPWGITAKQWRRLGRRTSALEKATVGLGAVALVTAALGRLGLGWLRCPSLLRMGKRLGCAGFGWIEAFFATTFEALVVLDLCRFALAAQQLARLLVPQLAGTLLVQNAVCLGGGASLPSAHDSPKTLTRVTLPSAHD